MGQIYAFEGIDGAGKTHAIKKVQEHLMSVHDRNVVVLNDWVLMPEMKELMIQSKCDNTARLMMVLLARSKSMALLKKLAKVPDLVILMDRYALSTVVYQCCDMTDNEFQCWYDDWFDVIEQFTLPNVIPVYIRPTESYFEERRERMEKRGQVNEFDRLDPKPYIEAYDFFLRAGETKPSEEDTELWRENRKRWPHIFNYFERHIIDNSGTNDFNIRCCCLAAQIDERVSGDDFSSGMVRGLADRINESDHRWKLKKELAKRSGVLL